MGAHHRAAPGVTDGRRARGQRRGDVGVWLVPPVPYLGLGAGRRHAQAVKPAVLMDLVQRIPAGTIEAHGAVCTPDRLEALHLVRGGNGAVEYADPPERLPDVRVPDVGPFDGE